MVLPFLGPPVGVAVLLEGVRSGFLVVTAFGFFDFFWEFFKFFTTLFASYKDWFMVKSGAAF